MQIALEPANQPEIIALINQLDAFQIQLYPPASHHGISLSALSKSNVLFAVARAGDRVAVGCGAIVLESGYGELKRMFVLPLWRGRGIGQSLLQFLEGEARRRGCRRFTLETGIRQPEAIELYRRCGYRETAPFGAYVEDPWSLFMEKRIAVPVPGP